MSWIGVSEILTGFFRLSRLKIEDMEEGEICKKEMSADMFRQLPVMFNG